MRFEYVLGIYYGLGVYNFAALEPKGLFRNGLNTQGFITQGFVGLTYGERYNLLDDLKQNIISFKILKALWQIMV